MMAEDTEILQAALDALGEGIAVLDGESRVLLWNPAATAIAGYGRGDVVGRSLPIGFYQMDAATANREAGCNAGASHGDGFQDRPLPVTLRHQKGHSLPAMLRRTPLRDELGRRFGTLLRFHPVEEIDTLPHGESTADGNLRNRLEESQAGVEERLDEARREWEANEIPFGVMWILLDQAAKLRRTHGREASEAMLAIVERTLLHGLRPTEILGRWGSNEFLVLSHERSVEMLTAHAQYLAGMTRTADFRWWGDRASLTVSIGVAQAEPAESLSCLLQRARKGMHNSQYSGGNRVTSLTTREMASIGGAECSQL